MKNVLSVDVCIQQSLSRACGGAVVSHVCTHTNPGNPPMVVVVVCKWVCLCECVGMFVWV